jgi:cytochrome c oxidase subunit 1
LPMHWLGLLGMPRRVATYDQQFGSGPLLNFITHTNVFVSVSAFVLGASMLLFAINAVLSATRGKVAGPNPWGARTLEWMTSSPPPYYNFAEIPIVLSGPYDYGKPLPYANISQDLATKPIA